MQRAPTLRFDEVPDADARGTRSFQRTLEGPQNAAHILVLPHVDFRPKQGGEPGPSSGYTQFVYRGISLTR